MIAPLDYFIFLFALRRTEFKQPKVIIKYKEDIGTWNTSPVQGLAPAGLSALYQY